MFSLKESRPLYEKLGLALVVAHTLLFLAGIPPLQTGFWYQTEPTMVAVFVLATLSAAWLAWGCMRGHLTTHAPQMLHILFLLWIGWQLLITPFAYSPWRSWFGPPEIGEGTGWHVAVLLCFFLCSALWNNRTYQKIILLSAGTVLIWECVMHIANYGDPNEVMLWRPARWPDYLAFMMGYLWIATSAAGYSKRPAVLCTLIILSYFALFTATNMTATVLIALAMIAATIMPYPRFPHALRKLLAVGKSWRIIMVICCLQPMLWVGFGAAAPYLKLHEQNDIIGTLSDNDDSMGTRVLLNRIGLVTLKNEPERLLKGSGWGNFTNDSYKYALVDGVHAYKDGIRKANAMHVGGSSFHSHAEPLEVLLSFGIVGLILWFAFPLSVIRKLPSDIFWHTAPMIVAIICLYYFWFALPQVLSYQAIALCALCAAIHPYNPQKKHAYKPQYLAGLTILTIIMGWSSAAQYEAMRYGDDIHFLPRKEGAKPHHTAWIKEDIKRGGNRLLVGAENFSLWGWRVHNGKEFGGYDIGWHDHFLAAAKELEHNEQAGARNQMLLLWMYYTLLLDYGDKAHDALRSQASDNIEASIHQLARVAPHREDIAAPFLMNLDAYTKGNIADQVEILVNILRIHPEHRSALWLLGHIYLTEPQYAAEGHHMIQQAIAAGVDRVYPITHEELSRWRKGNSTGRN